MSSCWPVRPPRPVAPCPGDNRCLGVPPGDLDPPVIPATAWIPRKITQLPVTCQLYFALEGIILAATGLNSILRAT